MNASELRNKSSAELKDQRLGLRQEQCNLGMQRGKGERTQMQQRKEKEKIWKQQTQ